MPPIANNWPDKSTVVGDVKVVYDEPGVGLSAGKLRINTSWYVKAHRNDAAYYDYLTFNNLGGVERQVMELVFSGMYGLFPVGIRTNQYVIKRLWSIVLVGETSPAPRLPKVFRSSPDMNASWKKGWRTYDLVESPYVAATSSYMNTWRYGGLGITKLEYGTNQDTLDTNPENNGIIEIPGIGIIFAGNLTSKDPFAVAASIQGGIMNNLLSKGYSQAQIDEYFKTGKLPTKPGNNNGPKPPASDSSNTPVISLVDYGEATVSVKTSNGYSSIPARTPETRPYILQRFTDAAGVVSEKKFIFNHIPQTISYTPGGSEWNEIPRSTDSPLVEWNAWSLTKVQMSFIVSGMRLEPGGQIVPDGINVDIEDELQMLRAMATLPLPVTIFGLDSIFDLQLRQAAVTAIPSEWAITDLSITAKRRTSFTPSLISVAQVSLSLVEYPIERQNLYRMPKLKIVGSNTPTIPGGGTTPGNPNLWTPILQPSVRDSIVTPTPTVTG
jgi:hypothetical protein